MGPVAEVTLDEGIARIRKCKPSIDKILAEVASIRESTGVYSTVIDEELRNIRRELTYAHNCLWYVVAHETD